MQRHARRADGILTSSEHSAQRIIQALSIPREHVVVAPPGPPRWTAGGRQKPRNPAGYVLFVGTLEPRKNLGALLDAYALLRAQERDIPPLRVAGRAPASAAAWVRRMSESPLVGSVDYIGYVPDAKRRALFEGASLLVLPSWHEGFGLPVLEAMALGVPVVTSDRGALPEVAGMLASLWRQTIRERLPMPSAGYFVKTASLRRASGVGWAGPRLSRGPSRPIRSGGSMLTPCAGA